jgi:carboxylesterase
LPAIHEAELLIKSVKRNLHKVTAPALIIHAVEDDVSTTRSADFVTTHIGSSNVHKVLLHDSYHMITMDNERELVASETVRFFDDLRTRSPDLVTDDQPVVSLPPRLSLVQAA